MRLLRSLTLALACALSAGSASAAFHFWNIQEVYTNASGTLQYIEFVALGGGQQFVNGQQISVSNVGASQTNTFTLTASLPLDSAGHTFQIGTAGLQAAGGPVPDFIIPNNFLFA